MEIEKSLNEMLGQLRTTLLDHALTEAKIRLFPTLMAKEHTIDIIAKINTFKKLASDFDKKESSFFNYKQIKSVRTFYINYLYTLKQLARATQKFLKTGTLIAGRKVQIVQANLNTMKKDIFKDSLDPERKEKVSSFIQHYPFDDPTQLVIDMDVRFFICDLRAKHLLKIVEPNELRKVAGLLRPVLETVYWFDEDVPRIENKFPQAWEDAEEKRLKKSYAPLQKFLGNRFEALEDLLFEHEVSTFFQKRVTKITRSAIKPIPRKKGYRRYQSCLKRINESYIPKLTSIDNPQEFRNLLRKAGLSKIDQCLVLKFGQNIYNTCKTALKKEGLFERAEELGLLPGLSFSDI